MKLNKKEQSALQQFQAALEKEFKDALVEVKLFGSRARANKALLAANKLFEEELYEDSVSRTYYVVLHAAKVALATLIPKSKRCCFLGKKSFYSPLKLI